MTKPPSPTIVLLRNELVKLGYQSERIVLDHEPYTRFTSPAGKVWMISHFRISYPFVTSAARSISTDKMKAYELADALGVTIPRTTMVDPNALDTAQLEALLSRAPLVVKPVSSSLSNGLTLNVTTLDGLHEAIKHAAPFSDNVLIQTQLHGEEVRFVILDGKVTAAILRRTARVVGDGVHTVAELLEAENQERAQLDMPYLDYPQLAEPLIPLGGIDMQRVPADGELVELGRGTMIRSGASIYDITGEVHETYLHTARKFALTLGEGFVVVDMFINDFRQPQTDDNYAFIEFNMSPVLKLFYSCRDGRHYDILKQLIPMIDRALHRRGKEAV